MYTTNAIESLNRSYRKYTKTKGVFTSDNSLMKCLFLATKNKVLEATKTEFCFYCGFF